MSRYLVEQMTTVRTVLQVEADNATEAEQKAERGEVIKADHSSERTTIESVRLDPLGKLLVES